MKKVHKVTAAKFLMFVFIEHVLQRMHLKIQTEK